MKNTLLNFSPCRCGMSTRSVWKPALILCIRLLSLQLAICLRSFLSIGLFDCPPDGPGDLREDTEHFMKVHVCSVPIMNNALVNMGVGKLLSFDGLVKSFVRSFLVVIGAAFCIRKGPNRLHWSRWLAFDRAVHCVR